MIYDYIDHLERGRNTTQIRVSSYPRRRDGTNNVHRGLGIDGHSQAEVGNTDVDH